MAVLAPLSLTVLMVSVDSSSIERATVTQRWPSWGVLFLIVLTVSVDSSNTERATVTQISGAVVRTGPSWAPLSPYGLPCLLTVSVDVKQH